MSSMEKSLLKSGNRVYKLVYSDQPTFEGDNELHRNYQRKIRKQYRYVLKSIHKRSNKRNIMFLGNVNKRLRVKNDLTKISKSILSFKFLFKELILTSKHLQAMEKFLAGNNDFLIVFEDDAHSTVHFNLDNINEMINLCSLRKTFSCYIDLCHHFPVDDLNEYFGMEAPIREKTFFIRSNFVANTTAAYIVNRKFAQNFWNYLLLNPEFRLISIDWLLSAVAIEIRATQQVDYFLASESIYTNHSLSKSK